MLIKLKITNSVIQSSIGSPSELGVLYKLLEHVHLHGEDHIPMK